MADAIDRDHLEQVVHSAGYELIVRRQQRMLDAKIRELLQPSGAEKTAELRGYIQAVQACLQVPALLKAEAQKPARPPRR